MADPRSVGTWETPCPHNRVTSDGRVCADCRQAVQRVELDGGHIYVTDTTALHESQRREVITCCARNGYGGTIDIAAREWARREPMTPHHMGTWLRDLADQIDPPRKVPHG